MKALVFDNKLAMKEIPDPEPGPGEALIRVLMAGICKTDAEIIQGYMNYTGVLGHEFVGVVHQSPDPELLGKRVVGEINSGCGRCAYCRNGLERHCPHRTVLGIQGRNGAFAEYLALPQANLVPLPENLSNEKAVFTEPLAAALEILEQVKILPSDRVLVIGDGKLGLLVSMVLNLTGCDTLLVGKHPGKLDLFGRMGGKVLTVDALTERTEEFDVVIEASGHPSGWDLATNLVKPRGTLVLKSTYHGALDFNPASLVINEITVVGSRCGLFPPAIRILERGLIDPTSLISGVFPFDKAEEAFKQSLDSSTFKVLLKM